MGIMSRRRIAERAKQREAGTYQAPEPKAPHPEKPKATQAKPKRVIEKVPSTLIERDAELTRRGE